GMNAQGIALSEKGASPDGDKPYKLNGTHFTTMFRDILYDAHSLQEAVDIIRTTPQIKKYRFYIGDGAPEGSGRQMGAVKVKAYAGDPNPLIFWGPNDPTDEVAPKIMDDVIYFTMNNEAAYEHLTTFYGGYDGRRMIELSRRLADDDGNLLDVVYDATSLEMWIAYAEGFKVASSRTYVHVDLKDYLDYPAQAPEGAQVASAGGGSGGGGSSSKALGVLLLIVPVLLVIGFVVYRMR
ncbi:MAG: hypothetical protein JXR94_10260, partial [Candidatus Hydrogenedentes bacterium]|nr:hypothetical protein [Candidatus Hydrogenedentota bacterium]